MKLSVIMPVYNEVGTIREILSRVAAAPFDKEIVVVDDGSTDGTAQILAALAPAASLKLLSHPRNRGKGAAIRTALPHVTGDIVVIQDADLEYHPGEYETLVRPILDGRADVVYGSRFLGGAHRVLLFWHAVGNGVLTLLTNLVTNLNLTDMETGHKAFRAEVLRDLALACDRFGFEPEVTIKVARRGLRVYEVPVAYAGRGYAEGKKITWRDGLAALWTIARFARWQERPRPPAGAGRSLRVRAVPRRAAWLALLVLASLGLRLAAWRAIPPAQYDNPGMGDTAAFLSLGMGLATGKGYVLFPAGQVREVLAGTRDPGALADGVPTVFNKAPGYPAFLAAVFRLAGYRAAPVRGVQILLSSLIPLLVFWLGASVFSRWVGVVAAVLAALYYPYIFWSLAVMSETLRIVLLLLLVLAWWAALRKPSWRRWGLAGVVTGATLSVHAVLSLLVPVILGIAAWRQRHRPGRAALSAASFLLGMAVLLWPWAHGNHRLTGRWIVFPAYAGHQLLWAYDPDPAYYRHDRQGWMDWPDATRSETFNRLYRVTESDLRGISLPAGLGAGPAREFESDRIRLRRAWRAIAAQPGPWLASLPGKFWNVWRPEYPRAHALRAANAWLCYALWIPWFLIGAWQVLRRGDVFQRLVLLVLGYHALCYLVFAAELRYRVPLMALFFVIAVFGLAEVTARVRAWRPAAPAIARFLRWREAAPQRVRVSRAS